MTSRTIKRVSVPLNPGKLGAMRSAAEHYAAEKQYWLFTFQTDVAAIGDQRSVRNRARQEKHEPAGGLPSTVVAMAIKDAAETMDKYWSALFVDIRRMVHHNDNLSKDQKTYAFGILKNYKKLAALFTFEDIDSKALTVTERKQTRNYLNRVIKRKRGALPSVKMARSFALDKCAYGVADDNGKQYLTFSKALCGRKLWVPLKGYTDLYRKSARLAKDGTRNRALPNIRVVLQGDHIEVHYGVDVESPKASTDAVVGVDFGYSEVVVDSDGNHHGERFGDLMTEATEQRTAKGRNRGKLYALERKHAANGDHKKARNIRKFNLGRRKLDTQRDRQQAAIEHEINTALNSVIKDADILVSEDLSTMFSYGKGKKGNRRLSSWSRGVLQERTAFKALAGCSGHQQVNPAYTSQTCPSCGFVHKDNRRFDTFHCAHCGHEGHADEVAALNILGRMDDENITRYTPYQRVKSILLERFQGRQESEGPAYKIAKIEPRCPSAPLTPGLETRDEEAKAA